MISSWMQALYQSRALGISALALAAFALPARGGLVTNGSFENVGTATSSFSINNPTVLPNWTASPSGNKILDCVIFSGATTDFCGPTAFGGGLKFWVNPGPSPDGGNFVGIDGDQNYATILTQTLTGLIAGTKYNVNFYQAAAQQYGFNGATTEQWQVSLDGVSTLSALMNTPDHGSVGWMSQTLTFTAAASSQVLGFLAVGTPNGQPPFVLLDGVSVSKTPEPATCALIGIGLLGIPLARRLRSKRA